MAEAPTVPRPGTPDGERPLPEHVTEPLLTLITQRSLDADYEHVAARRRARGQDVDTHPVPRRTAGLVLLVFGLLVTVAAVQTSRNASANDASRESLIQQIDLRRQDVNQLQKQLDQEQSRVLSLQTELNGVATERQATQARLERLQVRTGFGAVSGPGVQVSVNSAPGSAGSELVRDSDLTLLTDALWAAGAEAISVNGQRLTVLSAFRNVGIGILLNSQPINPPYVFNVVGQPGHPARQPALQLDGGEVVRAQGQPRVPVRRPQRWHDVSAGRPGAAATVGGGRHSGHRSHTHARGQRSMIAALGLLVGVVLGLIFTPDVPAGLDPYLPIAVVAALDAVFGALRAYLEGIFDDKVFVVSFFSNVVIAAAIVYLGDKLGVGGQLSTGVIVVLGIRIFSNVAQIRRYVFHA